MDEQPHIDRAAHTYEHSNTERYPDRHGLRDADIDRHELRYGDQDADRQPVGLSHRVGNCNPAAASERHADDDRHFDTEPVANVYAIIIPYQQPDPNHHSDEHAHLQSIGKSHAVAHRDANGPGQCDAHTDSEPIADIHRIGNAYEQPDQSVADRHGVGHRHPTTVQRHTLADRHTDTELVANLQHNRDPDHQSDRKRQPVRHTHPECVAESHGNGHRHSAAAQCHCHAELIANLQHNRNPDHQSDRKRQPVRHTHPERVAKLHSAGNGDDAAVQCNAHGNHHPHAGNGDALGAPDRYSDGGYHGHDHRSECADEHRDRHAAGHGAGDSRPDRVTGSDVEPHVRTHDQPIAGDHAASG